MSRSDPTRKPPDDWVKQLKDEGDVDELLRLLIHADSEVAGLAAVALGDLDERRAIEPLYRRLHSMSNGPFDDYEGMDWSRFASVLGWFEGAESPWADELLSLLDAGDRLESWEAGEILARNMGDRRAIEPLVRHLEAADITDDSRDALDIAMVTRALAELRATEAVDALCAALPRAQWSDGELIALALRDIGDPRAVPALISTLETRHGIYGDTENGIKVALEAFGTPAAQRAIEAHDRSLNTRRHRLRRWLRWKTARFRSRD